MQQAQLQQPVRDKLNAAGIEEVGSHVAATRLHVSDERGAGADPVEVIDIELNAGLTGDGEEVKHRVGRAARSGDGGNSVLERLLGDDVARADVSPEDFNYLLADFVRDIVLLRVHRRDRGAVHDRHAEDFDRHSHRVSRVLATASAGTGAGEGLDVVQFFFVNLAGVVGANRLEDVNDAEVLAVVVAGHDRSTVKQDRGQVEAGERHQATRIRLVTGGDGNEAVKHVALRHELDRVGDDFSANQRRFHALSTHADAVRYGNRVELEGCGAGSADPRLDPLGEAAQRVVAGTDLGPCVGDAD